jgi:hypothetical protein
MLELSMKRNRGAVETGALELKLAGAEQLPWPDATFDPARCRRRRCASGPSGALGARGSHFNSYRLDADPEPVCCARRSFTD